MQGPVTAKPARAPVIVPALIVLIGLVLRLVMLGGAARFHPDEALFAAQARLISHQADWNLRTTDLDKPPLTFYTNALSFWVFGPSETAARLPNVLFSSLSIAALYALTAALYRDRRIAALAALLIALCPYDLAFAATVFTDVQATFWTLIATYFVARDQWRRAGVATALAFAAKFNAILFVPLILALGITRNAQTTWDARTLIKRMGQWALPLALGVGLLVLWDLGRAPRSYFDLNYERNNPGRFIRSDELWPRLDRWYHWANFITGTDVRFWLILIALGLMISMIYRDRAAALDWQIAGFGIAFMGWLWLIAFNTYDRYLHTLAPFGLMLAARVVIAVSDLIARKSHLPRHAAAIILSAALLIGMLPRLTTTLRGAAKIGGDQGRHTGIDELAAYLNTELDGAIVYDYWLGWELAYYLGQAPHIHLIYQPRPATLAETMRQQTVTCYLVAPSTAAAAPWLDALHYAEIEATVIYDRQFVIYALEPPANPAQR